MNSNKREIIVSISAVSPTIRRRTVQENASGWIYIKQKTNFQWELLIHDDASTDRTAEIIREYAKRYPDRIFPILQTENQYSQGLTNISGTFNFPRARGKYIAMCEGDDYWTDETRLQRQVDFMEVHPGCSLLPAQRKD